MLILLLLLMLIKRSTYENKNRNGCSYSKFGNSSSSESSCSSSRSSNPGLAPAVFKPANIFSILLKPSGPASSATHNKYRIELGVVIVGDKFGLIFAYPLRHHPHRAIYWNPLWWNVASFCRWSATSNMVQLQLLKLWIRCNGLYFWLLLFRD